MNITVRNLTQAQLSTDLGLILPGQSVSVDLSPDEAYRASEGLRGFVAAGRCTVTVAAEPDLASDVGVATATTSAMTLYVETSGSDVAGDGSQARPFATIQKACDSVPKLIKHFVKISVGPGIFNAFYITNFVVDNAAAIQTQTPGICVQGSMATPTLTSGPTSGILSSASVGSGATHGTATVIGAGWAIDELKYKYFRITGGGGYTSTTDVTLRNNIRPIVSNTSNTITLAGTLPTGTTSTTTFVIEDISTIINTNGMTSNGITGGTIASNNQFGAMIGISSKTSARSFRVANLYFQDLISATRTTPAIRLMDDAYGDIWNIRVHDANVVQGGGYSETPNVYAYNIILTNDSSPMYANYLYVNTTNTSGVASFNNFFIDTIKGQLIQVSSSLGAVYLFSGKIVGLTTVSGFTSGRLYISSCRFDSCAYIFRADYDSAPSNTTILSTDISNSSTEILKLDGAQHWAILSGVTGIGNAVVVNALNGANVRINSTSTITGTTEISVDGSIFTIANMRLASPKYCTNATVAITGTKVWGN